MKKISLIYVILFFIIFTIINSHIIFNSNISGKQVNSVTNSIHLYGGEYSCILEHIKNNEDETWIITGFLHTQQTKDLDIQGIHIEIFQAIKQNDNYLKGELLKLSNEKPIIIQSGESLDFFICYYTDPNLKPGLYKIKTQFEISDKKPLQVKITKPEKGLYINNKKISPFFITIIIGPIDIEVEVLNVESALENVQFYIDNLLKKTDTTKPYSWKWYERTFGLHNIEVIAYDTNGNFANDKITVIKFF